MAVSVRRKKADDPDLNGSGAIVLSDRDFKKVVRLARHPRKPAASVLKAISAFRKNCPTSYAKFRDGTARPASD